MGTECVQLASCVLGIQRTQTAPKLWNSERCRSKNIFLRGLSYVSLFVLVGFDEGPISLSHVPSLCARKVASKATSSHLRADDQIACAMVQAIWSQGKHPWCFGTLKHKFSGLVTSPRGIFTTLIEPRLHYQRRDKHFNVLRLKPPFSGNVFYWSQGHIHNPYRATTTLPAQVWVSS